MNNKKYFLPLFLLLIHNFVWSQNPFTVSTYHNISLYWSPVEGSEDNDVNVEFKEAGTNLWIEGLPMKYRPIENCGINPNSGLRYDKADYRGSIVNLTPNTTYDIRLTLETLGVTTSFQATTWEEEYPIGDTITPTSDTTELEIYDSGTPEGYILYDGTGVTIDIQDESQQCISLHDVEYVIIRGFTLTNGGRHGLRLFGCKNIIIENCDISDWGEEDVSGTGFGVGYQSGIYASSANGDAASSCTIQRNKIHHPKWDTNSWAELHDPNENPDNPSNYHPDGPQAISFSFCDTGNNVIRYNEIWSDEDHYFNDILGFAPNASYSGFPGPDSDIYGNYLANCFDDGIESEGSNTNVRIWNNYIEEVFIGIGNAATSIGPLYIWRNVTGRTYSHPGSVYGDYGGFIKMGYASSIDWMTGHMYIFNNTTLQPDNHGAGGLGTHQGSNRFIFHCHTRNNILQTRSTTENSISTNPSNSDNSFDYDLLNHPYPEGHEQNGIVGIPTYAQGSPNFSFANKTGLFQLSSESNGFDDGVVVPNFINSYNGEAPDMGAHEAGWEAFTYGVNTEFIPPIPNTESLSVKQTHFQCTIYPNPVKTIFNIKLNPIDEYVIDVYDTQGKKIESNTTQNGLSIDTSIWSPGMYFVEVKNRHNSVVFHEKIIVR